MIWKLFLDLIIYRINANETFCGWKYYVFAFDLKYVYDWCIPDWLIWFILISCYKHNFKSMFYEISFMRIIRYFKYALLSFTVDDYMEAVFLCFRQLTLVAKILDFHSSYWLHSFVTNFYFYVLLSDLGKRILILIKLKFAHATMFVGIELGHDLKNCFLSFKMVHNIVVCLVVWDLLAWDNVRLIFPVIHHLLEITLTCKFFL